MSEEKCECMWCQKGITKEEAKNRRIDFITKVFELMFIYLFKDVEKNVEKATLQFKEVLTNFLEDEDADGGDVDKSVIDIIFYAIGLNSGLKPSDIYMKCYKMHTAIDNSFSAFRQDIRMEETPVLSGLMTPELFVANETGEGELPQELIDMYKKASKKSLTTMLESVLPVVEDLMSGEQQQPQPRTIH